jgi:AcrR family transcriptional regulator
VEREDTGRPRYGEGRQALVEAAIRVVAEHGLRGLTLRAVGAEAGVTHGLVRHHFGTRAALIEAAVAYAVETSLAQTTLEPASGRLEDLASDLGGEIDRLVDLEAFQFEVLLEARRRPELMPHVERMYAAYREAMARTLRAAGLGEDPLLAHVAFAALDGLVLQQVAFGGAERTNGGVARLKELLASRRDAQGP